MSKTTVIYCSYTGAMRKTGGDQSLLTFCTLGPPLGWFPPTFDDEHELNVVSKFT